MSSRRNSATSAGSFLRHGGKHDVWTNSDGTRSEYVPRHTEINEDLAKTILKNARDDDAI